MGILAWIVFGLLAGIVAKMLMPGNDPGGCIITILIGVAGAFIGGFIGTRLGFGSVTGFDFRSSDRRRRRRLTAGDLPSGREASAKLARIYHQRLQAI